MKKHSVRWAKKQWEIAEAKARALAEEGRLAEEFERALVRPEPKWPLFASLHTMDPSGSKSQEASYAGYARVALSREQEEVLANGGEAVVTFPTAVGRSTQTLSHVEVARPGEGVLFNMPFVSGIRVGLGAAPVVRLKITLS